MVSRSRGLFSDLRRAVIGYLIAALAALGVSTALCAAGYSVVTWDTDRGLPQNSVISTIQGTNGYLWLGTMNGLARFDGIQFTTFDPASLPGLQDSQIVKLFEDSKKRLWITTDSGEIALLGPAGFQLLKSAGRSRAERISAITEDRLGAVWLYSSGGQLLRVAEGRLDSWNAGAGRTSALRGLALDDSGRLWVATDFSLAAFRPDRVQPSSALPFEIEVPVGKVEYVLASSRGGYWRLANNRIQRLEGSRVEQDLGPYPWRWTTPVTAAAEDLQGNLVIGTAGEGVFWFGPDGTNSQVSSVNGLSHNTVLSIAVDREGSLWVGTDGGGLNLVKRHVFAVLESSLGFTVRSVSEGPPGVLWVGYNGDRIDRVDAQGVERLGPTNGLANLLVRSVFAEGSDRFWAGTYGGGLLLLQGSRFVPLLTGPFSERTRDISVFYKDSAQRLWVGMDQGLSVREERGWRHFSEADGLPSAQVRAVVSDSKGNLWIGTGDGLFGFAQGRFAPASHVQLPSSKIAALLADPKGYLWIGTTAGLVRFDGTNSLILGKAEGLPTANIGYLVADREGYLWIGSHGGLIRLAKAEVDRLASGEVRTVVVRTYGRSDGLPTAECTVGSQPASIVDAAGRVWFPTIKGLAVVDPAELKLNTNPPPVSIEAVIVEGQEQITNQFRPALPGKLVIRPGQERLEIHYTSLNLSSADRARFRYYLEGHDQTWTDAGGSRVARYHKLAPGAYQFFVTAANEDGFWNPQGASFELQVLPPFWKTWWFVSLVSLVTFLAVGAVIYLISTQRLQRQLAQMRQQEALEKERGRIARDLHDQLGANLTQVALLGELAEADKTVPEEVESHARQIQQTARETTRSLDEIVWTVNPQNDTLEGLVNYVCKYAQEYLALAGLRYRMEVPPDLPPLSLSPEVRHNVFLVAKEAVNNVVKHAGGTQAWLRLTVGHSTFTFEIEDDGKGLQPGDESKGRSGLKNMRKRMEDVGGHFESTRGAHGGTKLVFSAPLKVPRVNA